MSLGSVAYAALAAGAASVAIASAMKEFSLKRRRVFDIYRKYEDEMSKRRLRDLVR